MDYALNYYEEKFINLNTRIDDIMDVFYKYYDFEEEEEEYDYNQNYQIISDEDYEFA